MNMTQTKCLPLQEKKRQKEAKKGVDTCATKTEPDPGREKAGIDDGFLFSRVQERACSH